MRFGNDMITFEEAVAYLKDMPRFTVKKNPADSRDLKWFLKKIGNPEKDLRIIHVAGTNGKGSVCAYMSSILQAAGYRTAVFTSPHLVDMRERFAVNGEMISEEAFLQGFLAVWDALQETNSANTGDGQRGKKRHRNLYSTFMNTFSAWHYSVLQKKSPTTASLRPVWAGRLDATNYVDNKLLTVITRISLDHVQYLGDTTAKIAAEKAGILRPGVPVVYLDGDADASAVICRKASELGAIQIPVSKKDYTFLGFRKKYIDFSCALSIIIILVLLCILLHVTRWRMQRWLFGPWKCCFAVRTCLTAECVPQPGVPLWKRSDRESLAASGRDAWKKYFRRCTWMVRIMMTASGLFWIPWNRTAARRAGDCYLVWRRIRIAGI